MVAMIVGIIGFVVLVVLVIGGAAALPDGSASTIVDSVCNSCPATTDT